MGQREQTETEGCLVSSRGNGCLRERDRSSGALWPLQEPC